MNSGNIKVVIVDDHTMFRKGLSSIIMAYPGIEVEGEFENGKQLIQALRTKKIKPDLCLLDVEMRVMNGYETMQKLVKSCPWLKVLVISAHDTEFAILKMITLGAHGYLSKDTGPPELEHAIRFIHEHGYYHSDLIGASIMNPKRIRQVRSISSGDIRHISYICSEYSLKELGERLNRSPRTLEKRSQSLYKKLGVKSRTGVAVFAAQAGIKPWNGNVGPEDQYQPSANE